MKILLYALFVIVIYIFASIKNFIYKPRDYTIRTIHSIRAQKDSKLDWLFIILICLLFGIYSTICSGITYGYDRSNYVFRFLNYYKDPWTIGLNSIVNFLHLFTNNPKYLFFTISALCLLLTFIAYKYNKDANPKMLIYLFLSQYCIYSFYLFKQAPAIAFSAISITALFQKKWIPALVCLILAISFHESAYILIPLYLVLLNSKKRWVRILSYIFLISCIFAFSGISKVVSDFIKLWLPSVFDEVDGYLDEFGAIRQNININIAIKGFPFYFITLYGFIRRSSMKEHIHNYDKYMITSVFASGMIFLSLYMTWMWRFATYCYFPMFAFAAQLWNKTNNIREKQLFSFLLSSSLAIITFRYLHTAFFVNGGF